MQTPPDWAIRTEADRRAISQGYYWDWAEAERVIRFAERHLAPKFTSGDLQLFEWQRRFLMSLYGWRRPDGGRRFRMALLHVPKKNGKTLLVGLIAAYELFAVKVASPLVASASTTKENAKQIFEHLVSCCRRNTQLNEAAKIVEYRRQILAPKRDGEYRALSADAPNAEGLNCSAVIVDEAHAHRSPKLYRTLEYAMIGRDSGLIVVISTAGDDLGHWYYGLVQRGRNLLRGVDLDPTLYAEVYEADPETQDLDDPGTWRAANPSLDLYPGFTSASFKLQWEAAKSSIADKLTFERYRLNIFRRAEDQPWISLVAWDRAAAEISDDELTHYPCYLGLDGSQRIDPSSLSAVWALPGRRVHVRSWGWVAEEGVREREQGNLPKYAQFVREGSFEITEGNMIDKDRIRDKIESLRRAGHRIQKIVSDPNLLWVFMAELIADGYQVARQTQTGRFYSEPLKEFEAAVTGGLLTHDGSLWLRHCVNSLRVDVDRDKQGRPSRKKSVDHIDGAVAALMAFGEKLRSAATEIETGGNRSEFFML